MRFIAFHFSSGDAFFSGTTLIVAACVLGLIVAGRRANLAGRIVLCLGVLMVAFSATPLPLWFYAVWLGLVSAWLLCSGGRRSGVWKRRAAVSGGLLVACCLIAVGWEATYRFPEPGSTRRVAALYVLGDSISSGMEESPDEPTWPKQLRDRFDVNVIDLSHVGATARMAQKQALEVDRSDCAVLIEIGGNDLLGGTTADQFATDLETLLDQLQHPERKLIMLELPLPPFYNKYGRIQRELARRFDVLLIPRREFAKVIFTRGNTLDGLHLSEQGHREMAETIWWYVEPLFGSRSDFRGTRGT